MRLFNRILPPDLIFPEFPAHVNGADYEYNYYSNTEGPPNVSMPPHNPGIHSPAEIISNPRQTSGHSTGTSLTVLNYIFLFQHNFTLFQEECNIIIVFLYFDFETQPFVK